MVLPVLTDDLSAQRHPELKAMTISKPIHTHPYFYKVVDVTGLKKKSPISSPHWLSFVPTPCPVHAHSCFAYLQSVQMVKRIDGGLHCLPWDVALLTMRSGLCQPQDVALSTTGYGSINHGIRALPTTGCGSVNHEIMALPTTGCGSVNHGIRDLPTIGLWLCQSLAIRLQGDAVSVSQCFCVKMGLILLTS